MLGKSGGYSSRSAGSFGSGSLRNDRPDLDLTGYFDWPSGSLTRQKSVSFCGRILENEKYGRDEILGVWEFGNPEISHLFYPTLTHPTLTNLT